MKTIAFFSNKGRVGQTTLVYHLAWMFADMGLRVVAADLDPQCDLTGMLLEEERLVELWPAGEHPLTIQGVVEPIMRGEGGIQPPHVEAITDRIGLVVGDFGLSGFEDQLSEAWTKCQDRSESAFRIVTALDRSFRCVASRGGADLVLVDVGPNLGAINHSALIASQYVVFPVAPDLFSIEGLRHLGPKLGAWKEAWQNLREKSPNPDLTLPAGDMRRAGYVVMHPRPRSYGSFHEYMRLAHRIPGEYRESILGEVRDDGLALEEDPHCLAVLPNYRSLMPMAFEARKPMFFLKPADGAIGAHGAAVSNCYNYFNALAQRILAAVEFQMASDPA